MCSNTKTFVFLYKLWRFRVKPSVLSPVLTTCNFVKNNLKSFHVQNLHSEWPMVSCFEMAYKYIIWSIVVVVSAVLTNTKYDLGYNISIGSTVYIKYAFLESNIFFCSAFFSLSYSARKTIIISLISTPGRYDVWSETSSHRRYPIPPQMWNRKLNWFS